MRTRPSIRDLVSHWLLVTSLASAVPLTDERDLRTSGVGTSEPQVGRTYTQSSQPTNMKHTDDHNDAGLKCFHHFIKID